MITDIFGQDIPTKKLFYNYLETLSLSNPEELLINNNCFRFFKIIMTDYLRETLSLDDLSMILEKLWILLSNSNKASMFEELADICLQGAELNWNIRHNPNDASTSLKQIIDYYNTI